MSKKNPSPNTAEKAKLSKSEAKERLLRLQRYIGLALFVSAFFGIYLLATDKSLWLQAISHAYGLVAICIIDLALGIGNLLSERRLIIPSLGWAALTFILQVGDIGTAYQYHLTVSAFAVYLFGLWAFDGILLIQIVIIFIAYYTRSYVKMLARKKAQSYFEMGLRNSRRDFLQIGGTIGALLVIAAALGIWSALSPPRTSLPPPQSGNSTGNLTTSDLPSGAVANVSNLQIGVPVYFDYPSPGYTNALIKKADGSVSALSVLCTHVCCQCQYDTSNQEYYCPCHGSIFDKNGNVVQGPASSKLPSIELRVDANGYVYPTKIVGSGPCVQSS